MADTKKSLKKPGATTEQKTDATSAKAVTQRVIVNRELKYKYPEGMTDTLERKAHRQKVRNTIRKMERDLTKLEGKDKRAFEAKLLEYKEDVLI